jgi:hypothetical protein
MKGITVRFSQSIFEMIRTEAERDNASMSTWIAEAATARMMIARTHRGEIPEDVTQDLLTALRAYLEGTAK